MIKKLKSLSRFGVLKYKEHEYTEEEILIGIANMDNAITRLIYNRAFQKVKAVLGSMNCNPVDIEEIFQDGFVAALSNVKSGSFKGNSTFETYLVSICKNMYLKMRQSQKKTIPLNQEFEKIDSFEPDMELLIKHIAKLMRIMDETCREIFELRFGLSQGQQGGDVVTDHAKNLKYEEIASFLNISTDNARKRFSRCLNNFKRYLATDETWNNILKPNY